MRVFALVLLAACGGAAPEAPPAAAFTPTAEQLEVLGLADAHDGNTDKVVSECAVCGLGMAGDPANAVAVGEYQVHMCSDTCKAHFEQHTAEVLANVAGVVR